MGNYLGFDGEKINADNAMTCKAEYVNSLFDMPDLNDGQPVKIRLHTLAEVLPVGRMVNGHKRINEGCEIADLNITGRKDPVGSFVSKKTLRERNDGACSFGNIDHSVTAFKDIRNTLFG